MISLIQLKRAIIQLLRELHERMKSLVQLKRAIIELLRALIQLMRALIHLKARSHLPNFVGAFLGR